MRILGILEILSFFILLVILAAAVYGVVAWRRRSEMPEADPGIGTVRRLYFYTVAIVSLMMAANGVVLIIQFILEGLFSQAVVSPSSLRLAAGVSLTIVGLPLWVFHWWFVQRYVSETPVETRSLLRKFYIYVVLGVAAALLLNSSVELLQWIFRTGDFSGYHWGALVIWSAVWAFHWRVEQAEGQPNADTLSIRRLYLYIVSLVTLVMLSLGTGRVVYLILLEGYDALFSIPVLVSNEPGLWRPALRGALSVALVGGAAWSLHWLYVAREDYASALRQVYLYVFAVLGGIVTILIASGIAINSTLVWLFGAVVDETTAMHFRFLPGAIATVSVGIGLWAYHWMVVQREAAGAQHPAPLEETQAARRTYAYILSAIGLGASAVAVYTLVSAALGIFTVSLSDVIVGENRWQRPIALSITLGILGLPLWGYYWTSLQRRVSEAEAGERSALSRRIFIFAALGAGVLALLGSVSTLLFFFLRDLLEEGLSLQTMRDITPPISIIVAALVFLPYYWGVYRQDREAEPEEAAPAQVRKEVTVLVSEDGGDFVRDIESALGYRVTTLRWADPDASQPELSGDSSRELAQRVSEASGSRVLLIPDGATVRVLSYS